jgi:putative glutamine amidotransferase
MISSRPLIGLTGRRKVGHQLAGFPQRLAHLDIDVYVTEYARAITAAGGLPVHLPQDVDPAEYAGHLDGLLLSGGTDVQPSLYGAEPDAELHEPEPERDRTELGLVDLAIDEGIPVLGICRGLQVLNVWGGGSLHQHVSAHARYDIPATERVDELELEPGSRLYDMYGPHYAVNSLHHQAVDRVAPGWTVVARSADGTVEALEWPGHDVIAVQWHPELLAGAGSDPIFAWLVERAGLLAATAS